MKMLENVGGNNVSERADWQRNHDSIVRCILSFVKPVKDGGEGRFPSYKEMEMVTGLHQETIRRHSKSLDFSALRERSRLLAEDIFLRQALRARSTGDHNAAKTYFKLNYDWAEKTETKMSGSVDLNLTLEERKAAIAERKRRILAGEPDEAIEADFTDETKESESPQNGESESPVRN